MGHGPLRDTGGGLRVSRETSDREALDRTLGDGGQGWLGRGHSLGLFESRHSPALVLQDEVDELTVLEVLSLLERADALDLGIGVVVGALGQVC